MFDVGATLLEAAGVHGLDGAEGIPLLRYANGERQKSLWTTLVGHRGVSMRDGPEIGLRADGFKLIAPLNAGSEWYDLSADPGEAHNLGADPAQGAAYPGQSANRSRRSRAAQPARRSSSPDAMLEALGYQQ